MATAGFLSSMKYPSRYSCKLRHSLTLSSGRFNECNIALISNSQLDTPAGKSNISAIFKDIESLSRCGKAIQYTYFMASNTFSLVQSIYRSLQKGDDRRFKSNYFTHGQLKFYISDIKFSGFRSRSSRQFQSTPRSLMQSIN